MIMVPLLCSARTTFLYQVSEKFVTLSAHTRHRHVHIHQASSSRTRRHAPRRAPATTRPMAMPRPRRTGTARRQTPRPRRTGSMIAHRHRCSLVLDLLHLQSPVGTRKPEPEDGESEPTRRPAAGTRPAGQTMNDIRSTSEHIIHMRGHPTNYTVFRPVCRSQHRQLAQLTNMQ